MADEVSERGGVVQDWERLTEESLVETPIFSLKARRWRHPKRGNEGVFYSLESNDWVNILPLTKDGQIVMVRQFRFGIGETCWEIPGGVMEPGEQPVDAGLRELREETGYVASQARLLASIRPNPAIQSNACHLLVAENCLQGEGLEWDEHEELEIELMPIDEVYAMALRGGIVHSLVLSALLHYYPRWQLLKRRRRSSAEP